MTIAFRELFAALNDTTYVQETTPIDYFPEPVEVEVLPELEPIPDPWQHDELEEKILQWERQIEEYTRAAREIDRMYKRTKQVRIAGYLMPAKPVATSYTRSGLRMSKVTELRIICEELGIKKTGRKTDVIARILAKQG
jgi:hypothetical protein